MNKRLIKQFAIMFIGTFCFTQFVFAQQKYDIKEMTPEVKSSLESRRDRYDQINELKAKGVLGENNRGYLEVLKKEGDAEKLSAKENADRKVIYQTIADQNNLTEAISTIEKVFASVQREKASTGDMIQTEDGEWKQK